MEKETVQPALQEQEGQGPASSPSPGKRPWQEPKLAFVEPQLTKYGKLEELTGQGGFFGSFSP
jgi:hypothetical protein